MTDDRRQVVLEAPIGRALWSLAWPLVMANELNVLVVSILIFWLDRLLGETGLAVESLLRPVGLMALWLLGSVGIGAMSVVSRSIGAQDGRAMMLTLRSVALTVWLWLAIAVIAAPLAPTAARLLAANLPLERPLLQFLLPWLLLALPLMSLAELLLDVASATGWTRFGLVRVVTDLVVIALLVPLLIDTFGLGIAGAPIAEGIGGGILVALLAFALSRRRTGLGIGDAVPGWWRPDRAVWRELLRIGLPVAVGRAAGFAAQLVLVQVAAREGMAAAAGYGIAGALVLFGAMLSLALAQASGVVVGQSLGAGRPERARAAVRAALAGALAIAGAFVVLTLASTLLIAVFTTEPGPALQAERALSIMRWSLVGIGVWQVVLTTFAALKETVRAALLTVAADAAGVAFALLWRQHSPLVTVSLAFCVASWLKALLLALALVLDREAMKRLGLLR